MEPNNYENQFRKILNEREIKPSESAWNRLDAMLNVTEKPKKKFPWIYIAASIIGFLLIGTVYFNQEANPIKIQKNNVVNQNPIIPKTILNPLKNNLNTKIYSNQNQVVVLQKPTLKTTKISKIKEESTIIKNNNQNPIAKNSIINQKTEQKTITPQTSLVNVDELLASAGNSSKEGSKSIQKSVVHVNANNLLSQIDGELELSFREKVITKVNRNYQTVKVALANRNLE